MSDFAAFYGVRSMDIDTGGKPFLRDVRHIVPSKTHTEDTQLRERALGVDGMKSKISSIITLEFPLTPFEIYLSPLNGTDDEPLTIESLNLLHSISDEFLLRTAVAKRYSKANFKTTTIMQYRDHFDPLGILIQINKTLTYEVHEDINADRGEDQLLKQNIPDILSLDKAIISFYDDTQKINTVLRRLANHEISNQFQGVKEISFMRFLEHINPEMPEGGPRWIPELDIANFGSERNSQPWFFSTLTWFFPTLIIAGISVVSVGILQIIATSKSRISIHNTEKESHEPVTKKEKVEIFADGIC